MLSSEQRQLLLNIARDAVRAYLENKPLPKIEVQDEILKRPCGAFVTLNKFGQLRGCIGSLQAERALYLTIQEMAVEAAFHDPRFLPLSKAEFSLIEIEISVLSPLRRIKDPEEIEVGRDGLYLVMGFNRGTLLPQVATEYNWDKYTFLDHTCLKAGLSPGCWKKGAEIYVFEAEVFSEK